MAAPSLSDINGFLTTAVNQFQDPIYRKTIAENPYLPIVPRAEFKPEEGYTPYVVTTSAEMPTAYPDSLSNISASNGSGSAACDVDATEVKHGHVVRTYALEQDAIRSTVLCLSDLQFSWNAAQEIGNLQKDLAQYVSTRWADWYRIKNISMIDTKIGTEASGAFNTVDSSLASFVGLSDLPSAQLSWDHLDALYDLLAQRGASEKAPAMAGGKPTFMLACGPQVKRRLWQADTKVRDTVNWQTGNAALENFKARGIDTAINGFAPLVDMYPIRYAADGTTKIYPFVNSNATKGRKWALNPNYLPVAQGGLAVYEVAYVLSDSIWEARPRPTGSTQYGQAGFNPINYVGDLQWINNKTMAGLNDLGNKGYYRCDIQVAAKPIFPEFGFAILTLI